MVPTDVENEARGTWSRTAKIGKVEAEAPMFEVSKPPHPHHFMSILHIAPRVTVGKWQLLGV